LQLDDSQRFSRAVVAALKERRLASGLSQARLAEAAGISRTAVTMIEAGQRNPTLFVCHALAKALDLQLWPLIRKVEGQPVAKSKRGK